MFDITEKGSSHSKYDQICVEMSLQISNLYLLDLNLLNNTKWLVWVSHCTRGNKRKECDM